MSELSEEKKRILEDSSRVIIVKACPGSGKTRLFVEKAVQEIESLAERGINKGVAALSFTNSATDEIVSRLSAKGITGGYPNFVGTLDSFFQKFIVQPFAPSFECSHKDGINLIPGNNVSTVTGFPIRSLKHHYSGGAPPGVNQYNLLKEFGCWKYQTMFQFRSIDYTDQKEFDIIDEAKFESWIRTGNVTHNDVRSLACELLEEHAVMDIIANRFHTVLVDECQDADGLFADCLALISNNEKMNCFFVGDPDQSIFEFGGSNSDWLDDLASELKIKAHKLNDNFRCPQVVCDIALYLSISKHKMISRSSMPSNLILIEHTIEDNFSKLAEWHKNNVGTDNNVLLCHKNITLSKATSGTPAQCTYSAKTLNDLYVAGHAFYFGNCASASSILRSMAKRILINTINKTKRYEYQAMNEQAFLEKMKISLSKWKGLSLSLAKEAMPKPSENWQDWRGRMLKVVPVLFKEVVKEVEIAWGREMANRPKRGRDVNSMVEMGDKNDLAWRNGTEFLTVHKAKGLEFDSVMYFLPKPGGKEKCPSVVWFGDDKSLLEWRRVGYVAFTRAKKNLIVCLHEETVKALNQNNTEILKMFDEHIKI